MSKSSKEPENMVLETLKKIQGGIADLRNNVVDVRRDVRDLKASNAMILGMVGEMVKGDARTEERFFALESRIDRIEHQLESIDH